MNYPEILWVLLLVHIVSSLNAILEKKINRINVAPSVRTSVNNLVPLSFQIRAHTDLRYVIQIHTDPFYSGFCGLRSQRKQQSRHLWGVSIVMVRRGNSFIKSQLVFWDWWSKIDALIVACR